MAADFDPYHIWLGIPPEEQPANHYRLLGVRQFETNADAVDNAADRQMAHLRTFQTGKHADLSQRLLNELAAARICLLDSKRRAAYDQQLRAKLAATTAPAPAPADGSGIQRQPLRRMPVAVPMQPQAAPAAPLPQAAATPKPADVWDDLLGDPSRTPATKPGAKSAKAVAAKRDAASRTLAYGIAGLVVIAAAVGIGILATSGGSAAANGTLVFDLPAGDRSDTTVTVDGKPITIPADGRWDCQPGEHHIVGQRPAYKFAADVTVVAGQEQRISPEWRPKAVLVLNLPPELRSGELKVDGRVQTMTRQMPLQIAVEPGRHLIQIMRQGAAAIGATATVEADGRELVAIAAPTTTATVMLDWPADERKDAELTIDGHSREIEGGANPVELTIPPGKHVIRIARAGFESFRQSVELSAGANQAIKPTWTPEQKATAVADTAPAETAPQPVKKLAPPSAAEIERISKEVDNVYKTTGTGLKDPAKTPELYDVAAKDGSSPAERFVLLMKGAEIAAAAGDLNLSLQGIDTLEADYDIDALEAKQKLLDKFIAAGKPDQVTIAIPTAEQLIDQAVAADRYEIAVVLATTASKAVAKSKIATGKEDEERLARRRHDVRIIEPIYAAAKKAQDLLDKNPADPEANLAVGRWRCFYKNDWAAGLPLLAEGSDEKLKSLAVAELKAPTSAEQQADLADAWWTISEKEAGTARECLRKHAGEIYQAALPNLASALKKAAIEKRLSEITDAKPLPTAAPPSPNPRTIRYTVTEAGWKLGEPGVELVPKNSGFCFLSSLCGNFAGYGEGVGVRVGDDGFWSLDGHAGVDFLTARAISIEHLAPKLFKSDPKEFHWRNGDPPVKMLNKRDGICFLSSVEGHFEGNGEEVAVRLKADGYWYLEGRSGQSDLGAGAMAIRWMNPGAHSIETKEQSWTAGGSPVELLKQGEGFAFLSSVSGRFAGGGEEVRVRLGDDGRWWLEGRSGQAGLTATATTVRVAKGATHTSETGPAESPVNRWVDILKLVDTTKNADGGNWSRSGSEITGESSDVGKLVLPVTIEGSYEMEVEFTRVTGNSDINTALVVGSHQCVAQISAGDGHGSGINSIDGHDWADQANPTHIAPAAIETGHRYKLLLKVVNGRQDHASIDVTLDGSRYLPHWEGGVSSLAPANPWEFPTGKPGLAIFQDKVVFHSVRLRMLSGHATLDPDAAKSPAP